MSGMKPASAVAEDQLLGGGNLVLADGLPL